LRASCPEKIFLNKESFLSTDESSGADERQAMLKTSGLETPNGVFIVVDGFLEFEVFLLDV
jgi:hypothetical protein